MNQFSKKGNALPPLGVGITYSPELDEIVQSDCVDYLEIEPQTLWYKKEDRYEMPEEVVQHLVGIDKKKLIHSVGLPVGGIFRGEDHQIELLNNNIEIFQSPWASEHLGFNRTADFFTGFFLPPLQTEKGIAQAVQGITYLQNQLSVPFAVETGVNYLRPRKGEIADGTFISEVIEQADCGLLLDLHNLYANELNGRQSIDDFLKQIPLHRVLEVHLAGGFEMDGFWLDAHSGNMPDRLIQIASEVIAQLPNLKAITYEILPSYLPVVGISKIKEELHKVRELWSLRNTSHRIRDEKIKPRIGAVSSQVSDISVTTWEREIGLAAIGRIDSDSIFKDEAGIQLVQKLVEEFRASMLVTTLRLTYRLMALSLGNDVVKIIFKNFWSAVPPGQFASDEALNFAKFLTELELSLPNLKEVLLFEESSLRTLLDGKTRIVEFSYDPFPLLRSLAEGKLSTLERQMGTYEIEITGDDSTQHSNKNSYLKYAPH
jgi:uncharacterized protein